MKISQSQSFGTVYTNIIQKSRYIPGISLVTGFVDISVRVAKIGKNILYGSAYKLCAAYYLYHSDKERVKKYLELENKNFISSCKALFQIGSDLITAIPILGNVYAYMSDKKKLQDNRDIQSKSSNHDNEEFHSEYHVPEHLLSNRSGYHFSYVHNQHYREQQEYIQPQPEEKELPGRKREVDNKKMRQKKGKTKQTKHQSLEDQLLSESIKTKTLTKDLEEFKKEHSFCVSRDQLSGFVRKAARYGSLDVKQDSLEGSEKDEYAELRSTMSSFLPEFTQYQAKGETHSYSMGTP